MAFLQTNIPRPLPSPSAAASSVGISSLSLRSSPESPEILTTTVASSIPPNATFACLHRETSYPVLQQRPMRDEGGCDISHIVLQGYPYHPSRPYMPAQAYPLRQCDERDLGIELKTLREEVLAFVAESYPELDTGPVRIIRRGSSEGGDIAKSDLIILVRTSRFVENIWLSAMDALRQWLVGRHLAMFSVEMATPAAYGFYLFEPSRRDTPLKPRWSEILDKISWELRDIDRLTIDGLSVRYKLFDLNDTGDPVYERSKTERQTKVFEQWQDRHEPGWREREQAEEDERQRTGRVKSTSSEDDSKDESKEERDRKFGELNHDLREDDQLAEAEWHEAAFSFYDSPPESGPSTSVVQVMTPQSEGRLPQRWERKLEGIKAILREFGREGVRVDIIQGSLWGGVPPPQPLKEARKAQEKGFWPWLEDPHRDVKW
ncbi:MAG: hypothetical protein M1831_007108 [Alyxoria varia]|nr:MAG: hypothetical protein M1831_007108 [Alyxoria varia]